MPAKLLGKASLVADTDTVLYTVPDGKEAAFSVNIVSTANAAKIRLSLSAADVPEDGEYIEYGTSLPASSVLERTGLVLDAGKRLVARTDVAGVNAVVYGIEE